MSGTGAVCCDIGALVSLDLPSAALDSSQIAGGFTADALSCRNQQPPFEICEAANGRAVARAVSLQSRRVCPLPMAMILDLSIRRAEAPSVQPTGTDCWKPNRI
jgi:hypothetical protein